MQRAAWRASPHIHNNNEHNNSAGLLGRFEPRAVLRRLYRHHPLGLIPALFKFRALCTREDARLGERPESIATDEAVRRAGARRLRRLGLARGGWGDR